MMLATTLSTQGGRRYPQMGGPAGVSIQRLVGLGTSATLVVSGTNAGVSLDYPTMAATAPGTALLGSGGGP